MEITYAGGDAFLVKGNQVVAINPERSPGAGAIVLHSRRRNNRKFVVDGPGEYEIGGVLIATVEAGSGTAATLAHAVELDGLNVVYLGRCTERLRPEHCETLGKVDVLLIKADDLKTAERAVRDLAPRVVIPYGPGATELCTVLGLTDVRTESRFVWNGSGKVPNGLMLRRPAKKSKAA